jgi:hypothetical protein
VLVLYSSYRNSFKGAVLYEHNVVAQRTAKGRVAGFSGYSDVRDGYSMPRAEGQGGLAMVVNCVRDS